METKKENDTIKQKRISLNLKPTHPLDKNVSYKHQHGKIAMPMAHEILRLQAFIEFMFVGNLHQVSRNLGLHRNNLRRWSEEDNWPQKRQALFGMIQDTVVDKLASFADRISTTLEKTLAAFDESIAKIPQSPMTTNPEMWRGIKEAAEAIQILAGMAKEERDSKEMSVEQANAILEVLEAENAIDAEPTQDVETEQIEADLELLELTDNDREELLAHFQAIKDNKKP